MKVIHNVKVGRAKVKPTAPHHIRGIRQGNETHAIKKNAGLHVKRGGKMVTASARRSTGVNALFRNSIVPGAPRLTPM
jgi:hypothetical protein